MVSYFKYGGLMTMAVLFMLLGIHVLVGAYRLNDPFSFMLTFFASNFIILISATLLIGFTIRLWRHRNGNTGKTKEEGPSAPP
ncbi:MAG: hypothetical protein HZB87_10125 [Desulfatitalea sp.]|nr:hypothetical protein [Desulfatitalea sp.]